jgi:hypothetical protein
MQKSTAIMQVAQSNKTDVMKQWVLKEEVIDAIKSDQLLYGKVAKALSVNITSMPRILVNKSVKLTQVTVLEVIASHLQKKQKDLIELVAIAA